MTTQKTVEIEVELLRKLEKLAAMGLATEIVCHESSTNFAIMQSGMSELEQAVGPSPAFKKVAHGFFALREQYRLLAPMQRKELRGDIGGKTLVDYVVAVTARTANAYGVAVRSTKAIENAVFVDNHLLWSVVVNLVQNALFWTGRHAPDPDVKEVLLHFKDNCLLISDSGPGVEAGDIPKLFTPYFSRRAGGHGIGLYACKKAMEPREVFYTTDGPLPGATFGIRFPEGWTRSPTTSPPRAS